MWQNGQIVINAWASTMFYVIQFISCKLQCDFVAYANAWCTAAFSFVDVVKAGCACGFNQHFERLWVFGVVEVKVFFGS